MAGGLDTGEVNVEKLELTHFAETGSMQSQKRCNASIGVSGNTLERYRHN